MFPGCYMTDEENQAALLSAVPARLESVDFELCCIEFRIPKETFDAITFHAGTIVLDLRPIAEA